MDGEDRFLVARAVASQDTAAFGELVCRHQSQVRNFLRKLTGDVSVADDLAQECFLHAWDKLRTFSGHGTFIGWLLKVAYTTFLQSKRKSKRYAEVLEEAAHVARSESTGHRQAPDETFDVARFLAVVSEEERAILIMSYASGLSHREISEATGLPVGSVKSMIARSKEKIRTSFEIKGHQHDGQAQRR